MKAAFSIGQEMVSVFCAIKLKKFVVILIPFPDQDSPPPPPPPPQPPRGFSTRVLGESFATKTMNGAYWRGHMTIRGLRSPHSLAS